MKSVLEGGGAVRVTFVNHIDAQYYTFKIYTVPFHTYQYKAPRLLHYICHSILLLQQGSGVAKKKKNALKTFN